MCPRKSLHPQTPSLRSKPSWRSQRGLLDGREVPEVPCWQSSSIPWVWEGVSPEATKPSGEGDLSIGWPACHGFSENVPILKEKVPYPMDFLSPEETRMVGFWVSGKSFGHKALLTPMDWKSWALEKTPTLPEPGAGEVIRAAGAGHWGSHVLQERKAGDAGHLLEPSSEGSHMPVRSLFKDHTRTSKQSPSLLQWLSMALYGQSSRSSQLAKKKNPQIVSIARKEIIVT